MDVRAGRERLRLGGIKRKQKSSLEADVDRETGLASEGRDGFGPVMKCIEGETKERGVDGVFASRAQNSGRGERCVAAPRTSVNHRHAGPCQRQGACAGEPDDAGTGDDDVSGHAASVSGGRTAQDLCEVASRQPCGMFTARLPFLHGWAGGRAAVAERLPSGGQ